MRIVFMSNPDADPERQSGRALLLFRAPYKPLVMLVAVFVAAMLLGAGLTAFAGLRRQVAFVPLTPAPITAMHDWSAVAVKGQVAEVFGNKFILQDDSGRALVETGPEGEGAKLVAPSETITVQGRFERGFIHAVAISHADGRNDIVGPPGPPPHRGLLSWRGAEGMVSRWLPFRHPG
jgi:hypothetical protein